MLFAGKKEVTGTHLGVREQIEGLLIGSVGLLEIILHQIAVTWDERSYESVKSKSRWKEKNVTTDQEHSRPRRCPVETGARAENIQQPKRGKAQIGVDRDVR